MPPTTPNTADQCRIRALELRGQGKPREALDQLRLALRIQPDYAPAYYNIASIYYSGGYYEEAAKAWEKATELKPDYYQAYAALGGALRRLGRLDEGVVASRRAVQINPDDLESHLGLANLLYSARKFTEAAAEFEFVIQRDPANGRALNNYGNLLAETDQPTRAEQYYRAAMEADPKLADVLLNLANVLTAQGSVSESIRCYRQTLAARPDLWQLHSSLLLTLNYDAGSDRGLLQEHQEWAARHAARFYPRPPAEFPNDLSPDRRLRIGYVSCDFRRHSVAYFVEPILQGHDSQQVEVFCYSNVEKEDDVTRRFKALAHQWRPITGLHDDRVAQIIRDDRIDILVDLSGHTGAHRLMVFARKPAPVQVTYLGYPNTTGLATMDYRLADDQCDPPGMTDRHYVETLVRLRCGMWCYRPSDESPPARSTSSSGNSGVTFGCFNFLGKVTEDMIGLWARILDSVPNSTLLLKAEAFSDAEMCQAMRSSFLEYGADPSSLSLLKREPSFKKHLAIYHQVDIGLDTFPYHGTTTTCEAMWMGVPVITMAGHAHVSRVGVSLLSRVGLEELVARDPDEYVRIAIELARDVERRRRISGVNLRERMRMSALMDFRGFARQLELAYRAMWGRYCRDHGGRAEV